VRPELSGVRASLVVFVGVGLVNVANYGFHTLSARELGPANYADVATLTAINGIITLPLAGAQAFVARHVAKSRAAGRLLNDDGYVTGYGGAVLLAGVALTVALLATAPLAREAFGIHQLTAVVLTMLLTVPAFVVPVLVGAIQGTQRFTLYAVAIALPAASRVVLAALALALGLGVSGVMGATLLAGLLALVIPLMALRGRLGGLASWRPRLPRRELIELLPVVGGMLAVACLSTDDLVAAKVTFSAHEAGLYSSASLVGRLILYLPAAIVTVLLPKVSARASADGSTRRIFLRSFIATTAFCLLATAALAARPDLIMRVAFGTRYAGAGPLLWMFGVAMTIYALLSVLLAYRVGHGETGTCWLLLAGTIVQAAAFVGFHASPRELLTVSIACGGVLLVLALAGPTSRSPSSLRGIRRASRSRLGANAPLSHTAEVLLTPPVEQA
jgi:O-antigen/teichoic acid export membrane protein